MGKVYWKKSHSQKEKQSEVKICNYSKKNINKRDRMRVRTMTLSPEK